MSRGVTIGGFANTNGTVKDCSVTNTLYGNQVAPTIMREYGGAGGCLCGMPPPKRRVGKTKKLRRGKMRGGGNCSGQPTMLRALGIMAGGSRSSSSSSSQCKPGAYKPTRNDIGRLRRHIAGKSIGFTQRASLKAKGLLRRANGSCKVSKKYQ